MKMKKGDKFVMTITVLIFIIAIVSTFYYFSASKEQNNLIAEIYLNNEKIHSYDLGNIKKQKVIRVKVNNDEYNEILIEHNRIRFNDANCHDKVCVRTGWLTRKGEIAVCLPHKVYIKIVGNNEEVDAGTY